MKQDQYTMRARKGYEPSIKPLNDNPGPGHYHQRHSAPSPGVTSIKSDINPNATYCNRIVEYNFPGPSDYSHSIDFGARYKNYLDKKPVY